MSFSSEVKTELRKVIPTNEHCLSAMAEARKYLTLVKKDYVIDEAVLEKRCCKRAFLREAFLLCGTMNDPAKSYHFEILCPSENKAEYIKGIMNSFDDMDARVTKREKNYSVYLKNGDMIVDMLGIMEAPKAFMELENARILKSMRNMVNRRVNCETANINKTVSAAQKQTEDIEFIRDTVGLRKLSPSLYEMALARLEYPDATLSELALKFNPPITKSGANHRLRKIAEYAESLKEK